VATDSEILAQCDAAITAILGGHQSHSAFGRTYTKADLSTLWNMRRDLQARVNAASAGGVRVQYVEPV
jgi:hypothetical protein